MHSSRGMTRGYYTSRGDSISKFIREGDTVRRGEEREGGKEAIMVFGLERKGSRYMPSYCYHGKGPRIPRADLTRRFYRCSRNWDLVPKILATSL